MVQQTNNNFSTGSFGVGTTGALPEQQMQQQQPLIKNFDTMQQPGLMQGVQTFPSTIESQSFVTPMQQQTTSFIDPVQSTSFVDPIQQQSFISPPTSMIPQQELLTSSTAQQDWVPQSYLHPQPVEVLTQGVELSQPQFASQSTYSIPQSSGFVDQSFTTQEFAQPFDQQSFSQPLQSTFESQSFEFSQQQSSSAMGSSLSSSSSSIRKLDSKVASHPDALKGSNYDNQGLLIGCEESSSNDLAINIKPLEQSLTAEERKEVLETHSTHSNVDQGPSFTEAKRKLEKELNFTVVPVKQEIPKLPLSATLGATVQSAKDTVVEGTKSAVNSTVETVGSVANTTANVVQSTAKSVGSTAQSAKETIQEAHIPEKISNAVTTTANVVGSTVQSAKETIKEAHIPEKLASAANTTSEVVGTTYETVKEAIQEAHIPEKIAQVATAVATTVGSLANSALSTAEEVKEEVKETAKEVKEEAKQEMKPLTSEIKPLEVKPLTSEFSTSASIPIQPKEHSFHITYSLDVPSSRIESSSAPSSGHVTYSKKIQVQPITSDVKHIPLTGDVKPLGTTLSSELKPTSIETTVLPSSGAPVTYSKKIEVQPVTVPKEELELESEATMEEIIEEVAPGTGWVESAINLASAATHAVGETLHNAKEMVKEAHIPEKLGHLASSTAQVVGSTLHSTKEAIQEANIPEKVGTAVATTANVVGSTAQSAKEMLHQVKESAVETAEELAPEAPVTRSHIDSRYRDTEIVGMSPQKFDIVSEKLEEKLQSGDGAHPISKHELETRGVKLGSEGSHIDSLKRDTNITHMGEAKFERTQEILEKKLEKKEL